MDIVHLTTILVKLHYEALQYGFANRNEIILHFGNMKNLSNGRKQQFTSNSHCGLDAPFAKRLKNGVISHVHLSCNNEFIIGEPLSFKCHVLCYTRIDDPIVRRMIINTQGNNKKKILDLHKLGLPFLSYHSYFSNNSSQSVQVFYNKKRAFRLPYEFCSVM
jgi:hypothetical protein